MEIYAKTDVGSVRSINQDYVFATDKPVGNLKNLFIVADGMGGHKAGDLASKFTVETFVKLVEEHKGEGPITIIQDSIKTVNKLLLEKAGESEDYKGMGTTLVVATLSGRSLYIANVGDSRLYVLGNELSQITRDHSYVEEMVDIGEMNRDDDIYRIKKNIITRAIGAGPEIMADFFDIQIKSDNLILMCSDGLTGMVSDDAIKEILNTDMSVKEKTQMLIDAAKENGGKDNIGVVLVKP